MFFFNDFASDTETIETIFEHLLGKLQSHCANAELFHNHAENETYFDKSCENEKLKT